MIWLPTPLGLGSWLNQSGPLASYLQQVLPAGKFRFAGVQPDCLLEVMENQGSYLMMVTNGSNEKRSCHVIHPDGLKSNVLWGLEGASDGRTFELGPRGTSVVLFSPDKRSLILKELLFRSRIEMHVFDTFIRVSSAPLCCDLEHLDFCDQTRIVFSRH